MDAQSIAIIIGAVAGGIASIIGAYQAGLKKPAPDCTCKQDHQQGQGK